MSALLLALGATVGTPACGRPVSLAQRPCPCVAGYVCCAGLCAAAVSGCPAGDGAGAAGGDAGAAGDDGGQDGGRDGGQNGDDGPPARLAGRLLYPGVYIENPHLLEVAGDPWVEFDVRRAPPDPNGAGGGLLDVHVVKWADAATHRLMIEGVSDRVGWPRIADVTGARFVMTNERVLAAGPVGTLNRISPTTGAREQIADVTSYSLGPGSDTFLYRRIVADAEFPELHLHDLAGRDRNLGPQQGQLQWLGGTLFYLAGADHTLTRAAGWTEAPVPLRAHVGRFLLLPNAAKAIVVIDNGNSGTAPQTLLLDLTSHAETTLPIQSTCCWLGTSGSTFVFAEPAATGRRATLHELDLGTLADHVVTVPPPLVDVVALRQRPGASGEIWLIDSERRVASYRPASDPVFQVLPFPASALNFTADGRYLLFIVLDNAADPAAGGVPTGQLFVQDLDDPARLPRLLSPPGTHVPIGNGYLLRPNTANPLVFWSRAGVGSVDLYLGDHVSGVSQRIAERVGGVVVNDTTLFGIVELNDDLTGNLVLRNFLAGHDAISEPDVAAFDNSERELTYVVREKSPAAPRNGLWAAPMPTF